MNPKPLKERIREVLDYFGSEVVKFCALDVDKNRQPMVKPKYTKDEIIKGENKLIDQALQAILTEIKGRMPEKQKLFISLNGKVKNSRFNKKIEGYNLYHDEMRKLLE